MCYVYNIYQHKYEDGINVLCLFFESFVFIVAFFCNLFIFLRTDLYIHDYAQNISSTVQLTLQNDQSINICLRL
jgi:hypothetical protein